MSTTWLSGPAVAATLSLCLATPALAQSVTAPPSEAVLASFDIVETKVVTKKDTVVFSTRVRGKAGVDMPTATGKFEGSEVYAYVWPTSLNSAEIGFEKDQASSRWPSPSIPISTMRPMAAGTDISGIRTGWC